jgi:hypothetical protein
VAGNKYVLNPKIVKSVNYPSMGADPEFFFKRDDGVAMNADYFLPHRKKKYNADGSSVQLFFDGFQGELNFSSGTCREGVLRRIRTGLRHAHNIALAKSKKDGVKYRVALESMVPVEADILAAAHEEAREFGCDPDFDAYSGGANPPGPDAEDHLFRYSGGHIHMGATGFDGNTVKYMFEDKAIMEFVKLMDILVGIPLVILDRDDGSARRREIYGRAGCYRKQKYGVEYRVPSNFWLKSPELTGLALGLCRFAFTVAHQKLEKYFFNIVDQDAVRYAIDMNDFDVAKELWSIMKPNVVAAASAGRVDVLNSSYTRRFTDGLSELVTNFPGYTLFEFVAHKGVDKLFGSWTSEWSITGNRPHSSGWFTGMTQRIWDKGLFSEFVDFYPAAIELDNVAF